MIKCKFATEYYDYKEGQLLPYNCPEKDKQLILESGLCIFHDEHFLDKEENHEIIIEEFQKKVDEYISNTKGKPFFCIGYRLSDVYILGKEFPDCVYFNKASISGALIVSGIFRSHADFNKAEFLGKGDIVFTMAEFLGKGDVIFENAKFKGEGDIKFNGVFSNEGNISFIQAEFSKEGNIEFNARFSNKGHVLFNAARFSEKGYLLFVNTQFSNEGTVSFSKAEFSKEDHTYFLGVRFSGVTDFIECTFKTEVNFNWVRFVSSNEVRFDTEDMSNVSFINTDITGVIFGDNTRFGVSKKEKDRFKIIDERKFEKIVAHKDKIKTDSTLKNERLSLGNILASYRNLRENYEYRLRYDEAGKFFIREMELKRKYREEFSNTENGDIPKQNDWFRQNFSFIGLYHNVCNYGESSTRPLILFGIIMILSSVYWLVSSSIEPSLKTLVSSSCNEPLLLCSLERTLKDIVSFPEKGIIIDYATRISSIIVLATLFLPFRRKFERRFRH
jgi:uncharacterized protein YjbI with pentapeptide repeats